MLHVQPSVAEVDARPAFDPIAYVAYCRDCNVAVTVNRHNAEPMLSFDISKIRTDVCVEPDDYPYLNINNDPEGRRKVYEVICAEEYLAAARASGLCVFPWFSTSCATGKRSFGMMELGQEMDGPNDYSAASERFLKHPARALRDEIRRGLILQVLMREFDVEEDDPDFCAKVNAQLETERAAA